MTRLGPAGSAVMAKYDAVMSKVIASEVFLLRINFRTVRLFVANVFWSGE